MNGGARGDSVFHANRLAPRAAWLAPWLAVLVLWLVTPPEVVSPNWWLALLVLGLLAVALWLSGLVAGYRLDDAGLVEHRWLRVPRRWPWSAVREVRTDRHTPVVATDREELPIAVSIADGLRLVVQVRERAGLAGPAPLPAPATIARALGVRGERRLAVGVTGRRYRYAAVLIGLALAALYASGPTPVLPGVLAAVALCLPALYLAGLATSRRILVSEAGVALERPRRRVLFPWDTIGWVDDDDGQVHVATTAGDFTYRADTPETRALTELLHRAAELNRADPPRLPGEVNGAALSRLGAQAAALDRGVSVVAEGEG